jgi:two-component system, NtrC family, sensor kinase
MRRTSHFADQAVISLQNARMLDELEGRPRELQEALDYQTATTKILQVIGRSPSDAQPVCDAIVEAG